MAEQCTCAKCRKTMSDVNFYTYKSGQKSELCKNCLTMHINNWEPDTFLWLLEKFDVPYIPQEWNVLRDRAYAKDPKKMNSTSVFGKYLSKMKLKQWKNFTWADSERLQLEAEEKAKLYGSQAEIDVEQQQQMKEAYEHGEISEAQYKTYMVANAPEPQYEQIAVGAGPGAHTVIQQVEPVGLVDVGADLTAEDKTYLAMKWGRLYSAADWVALEKLYTDFQNSFDIQDAGTDKTLMFICKTALKMDQALDAGDIDTYQKLSRVYDAQMKAAKFTAAQNKDEKTKEYDAIGQLVLYCEKEGGAIPKYEIDTPLDIIDKVIDDMKNYTKSLIETDSGLAQQIENYIKKREIAEEQKAAREAAKAAGKEIEVTAEDTLAYGDAVDEQLEEDYLIYNGEEDE